MYTTALPEDKSHYPTGIWIANLRTGQQHQVSEGRDFAAVQVRPGGGNWLTCTRGTQTWNLNVTNGTIRQLTYGPEHNWPWWSPNGQELVGSLHQVGLTPGGYLCRLDSAGQRIPTPALEHFVVLPSPWSPDGKWLMVQDGLFLTGPGVQLYNLGTAQLCSITLPSNPDFDVAWLPDSQGFVWCGKDGIFATTLANGTTVQLRTGCERRIYNRITIASNGKMIVVERTDRRVESDSLHMYSETNLWTMNLDGSNERKMVFRNSRQRK